MTTKDRDGLSAMGLFRDGLGHDITTKEASLRANLEGLRREIDRALKNLADGHRVNRGGIVLHRGIDIDHECVALNELYNVRNGLDAALAHDAKGGAK